MNKGFEPIEIEIKDNSLFMRVAHVVDSPIFLKKVEAIRKDFKIDQPFKYGDFKSWDTHLATLSKTLEIDISELSARFEKRILELCISSSGYFIEPVKEAVLFRKVGNIKPAYPTYIKGSLAILFTPLASKEDIVEAFREFKEDWSERNKLPYPNVFKNIWDKKAELSSIQRNRLWYWAHHKSNPEKLGYRKIAKDTGVEMSTIISGINAYIQFLGTSL